MNDFPWLLPSIVGLILLTWLVRRRWLGGRRKRPIDEPDLLEDLAAYPPPPALWGEERLRIYGLPVRLRLVVVAPLGNESDIIQDSETEEILNRIVTGLGNRIRADKPRVRIWPTQLSREGFGAAFMRNTLVPLADNEPSRWVLITGRALVKKRPIGVALSLLADEVNVLGRINLEQPHEWAEALRIRREEQ